MKPTLVDEDQHQTHRVSIWRNRDFMLLWSGQTVSLVGTGITQTAFPLLVWDITHSAAQVGLVGGLGTLPYVLLSLLVGALIDRWDRKRVMILCDIGRALNLVSVLIALMLGSRGSLPNWVRWLTLVAGVLALTTPFYFSAPALPLWGIVVGVWLVLAHRRPAGAAAAQRAA